MDASTFTATDEQLQAALVATGLWDDPTADMDPSDVLGSYRDTDSDSWVSTCAHVAAALRDNLPTHPPLALLQLRDEVSGGLLPTCHVGVRHLNPRCTDGPARTFPVPLHQLTDEPDATGWDALLAIARTLLKLGKRARADALTDAYDAMFGWVQDCDDDRLAGALNAGILWTCQHEDSKGETCGTWVTAADETCPECDAARPR